VKRNFVSVPHLLLLLLTLSLICAPLAHARSKTPANPRDPYATAEYDTAPAVKADDLAYRVILFDNFTIPDKWEADARKMVTATEDRAISRLISTGAFATVAKKQSLVPAEPYLVVKCTLVEYRMVSGKARFFAGVAAGSSYFTYQAQVYDGKSGTLLYQREVSSENNAFAGTFSNSDQRLPTFLGNVLGDYLALRARKDKGVDVLPIEPLTSTGGK
jgi:hypothetical protein